MFGPFERAVAGRYLRARRGERFVSVIAIFSLVGIALGVGVLIVVMSVMNGFKADLLGRILGLNGDLSIYAAGPPLTNYDGLLSQIRDTRGVTGAIPLLERQAYATTGRGGFGALVRGVTQADLKGLHAISDNIRAGSLNSFAGNDAIAVGEAMAERFGLSLGSPLRIFSPDGPATVIGTIPRERTYHVAAIFQAGVNDYDTSVIFMPLPAAQIFFGMPGQVTEISVSVRDPDTVQPVTRAIGAKLRNQPLLVRDWTQSNNALFGAVQVEQNVMFLILTLIILVAAFNVVSSLIMMVKDKSRDIAVLRTLGAGRGAVMRIFLMCGASVGVAGTVIGAVLGILFALNIESIRQAVQRITGVNLFNPTVYFLEHLPAKLVPAQVAQVIVMALVLSLLATLYPSWRAARTDPVEALRHE